MPRTIIYSRPRSNEDPIAIEELDALAGEWRSAKQLLLSASNGLQGIAEARDSNTDHRCAEALRRVAARLP